MRTFFESAAPAAPAHGAPPSALVLAGALATLGLDGDSSPTGARKAHFKATRRAHDDVAALAQLDDALATVLAAISFRDEAVAAAPPPVSSPVPRFASQTAPQPASRPPAVPDTAVAAAAADDDDDDGERGLAAEIEDVALLAIMFGSKRALRAWRVVARAHAFDRLRSLSQCFGWLVAHVARPLHVADRFHEHRRKRALWRRWHARVRVRREARDAITMRELLLLRRTLRAWRTRRCLAEAPAKAEAEVEGVLVVPHLAMSRALVLWHGWLTRRVVARARRRLAA